MDLGWSVDDVLPSVITKFEQEQIVKLAGILSHQNYFSSYNRRGQRVAAPETAAEKIRYIIG
jgi:hypothetical protein